MSSTLGHSSLPSANAKKPKTYQKSRFTSRKVAKESAEVEESSDGSEVPEKASSFSKQIRLKTRARKRKAIRNGSDEQPSDEDELPNTTQKSGPPGVKRRKGNVRITASASTSAPSTSRTNHAYVEMQPQPSVPSKQKPLSRSQIFTSRSQLHADNDVAYGSPSNTTNFSNNYQSQAFEGFESEDALVSMLNTSGEVPPMRLRSPVFDISSDDAPPSPQSDTPSQLLDEVRKINDPLKLLNEARELALRLPPSIPEVCPGDFLHVWDATDVHAILLALPDGGKDPSEDCEYIDRTLNHIFQGVSVSRLAKEMRRGCCGALGIIEGLSFFAETHGLNLEQFEVKILKLRKALARTIDGQSPASGSVEWKSAMQSSRSAVKSPIPPLIATPTSLCPPSKPAATVREPPPSLSHGLHSRKPAGTIEVPFEVRYDQMVPRAFENEPNVSHNRPDADTNLDDDFDEEEEDDDILHESQAGSADNNPRTKQYKTGPLPVELLEEVRAITDAFDRTLVVTAEKYNRPLATAELSAEYAKEKGQYEDDPEGSKLAKFISRKKKNLMGEMSHMGTFDVHSISFIVCGRADAYAAHAQNAILCSSPEIQRLAEEEFNLKKTLDDLFVKVLAQRLDARGLSKWHQETEKKRQEDELRSRDSAYSAASKYLRNLFIENGHTWFPASVPWVRILGLLRRNRIRIVGWPCEDECPAPHPTRTNKSWEGGQWRLLVSEFHKGKGCPIKLEKWSDDDTDNDDDIPLIIDRNRVIVYRVQDANSGAGPEGGQKPPSKELLSTRARSKLPARKPHGPSGSGASSKGKNSKASRNLSKAFIENSDSEDLGPGLAKPATNPSSGLTEPNVGDTVHSYFGTSDNLNWEPGTVTNGNPSLAIGPMNSNFGATDPNLGASTLGSTNPGVVPQNWYAESFNTVLPPVTLDGFDFSRLVFNPDVHNYGCYTKHSEVRPSENLSTMHQVQNKGPWALV
ncbi:hypothetical protein BS47DRAFT_1362605 [Hydnum rufescens UP504]|uniref:Uncharacterized protein n=1 Tax=Hydnum rufescens UP504 TaxID=1448309 RepID=A0A9P6AWK5_9AGAM|nr:hypothetical protein BS47DRAFT_1362605 [Hydnum rufescens UP504]